MRILLLLILIPFIGFAQTKRTIFIESGISVYKPFVKHTTDDSYSTNSEGDYSSDLKSTYKTTGSFYMKGGLEIGSAKTKRFRVTFPVSFGYRKLKTEITTEGSAYGCFTAFNGKQITTISTESACLQFGPKFNFNVKRFTIFTALNFNYDLIFQNQESNNYNGNVTKLHRGFKVESLQGNDITLNASLQLGFSYKVNDRFNIGFSTDTYFCRLNTLLESPKQTPYFFNFGYGKRSAVINCGVRVGYSF